MYVVFSYLVQLKGLGLKLLRTVTFPTRNYIMGYTDLNNNYCIYLIKRPSSSIKHPSRLNAHGKICLCQ